MAREVVFCVSCALLRETEGNLPRKVFDTLLHMHELLGHGERERGSGVGGVSERITGE